MNKQSDMTRELLESIGGDLPMDVKESKVNQVVGAGVRLDDKLMVVADHENLSATVAQTLVEAKHHIDEARRSGKHVIYIPGSYDLVHAGHASYALQVTDQYLSSYPELTRDDLYVVMLSDDDNLISTVKAYKRKGYSEKGDEDFARPIESEEAFKDLNLPHHSRLLGTASLPVDLVGFIPSPRNAQEYLHVMLETQDLSDSELKAKLAAFDVERNLSDVDRRELTAALGSYRKMVDLIQAGSYEPVIEAFEALGKPHASVDPTAPWSIQSYQLFNHRYLASGNFDAPFVRVVSVHDSKYKDQVDFLMQVAGVTVAEIDDVELVSTTKLLKTFGPDTLRESKRGHFIQ